MTISASTDSKGGDSRGTATAKPTTTAEAVQSRSVLATDSALADARAPSIKEKSTSSLETEQSVERSTLQNLRHLGSIIKETWSFIREASPQTSTLKAGLAFIQSTQMLVYGLLSAQIVVGLQKATTLLTPDVVLPVLGMLALKSTVEFLSARIQSRDMIYTRELQHHVRETLRKALPDSVERMMRPEVHREVQRAQLHIWALSGAGNQLIQSFGSAASIVIGAGMLLANAPGLVTAIVAATVITPVIKVLMLSSATVKHANLVGTEESSTLQQIWQRIGPWHKRLYNSVNANQAIDTKLELSRNKLVNAEQSYASKHTIFDVVGNIARFSATLCAFALLGKAVIAKPDMLGSALFVGMSALPLLTTSLDQFAQALLAVIRCEPGLESLKKLRQIKSEEAPLSGTATIPWNHPAAEISLSKVHYAYPSKDKRLPPTPLLEDVSLHIPAGSTVAIVGDNGAGKSTLLQLLDGSLSPIAGSIMYEQTDIARVTPDNLFQGIGVHIQNPQALTGFTFREFLSWARVGKAEEPELFSRVMEATGLQQILSEEVVDAAGISHKRFPQGLDTLMGAERGGVNPSGGELSVLFTTFMLYKQPKVLVLDEPTSGLSQEREKRYYDVLFGLKNILGYQPTIVLVTHDLDRATRADTVVFVDKERRGVGAVGKHQELLQNDSKYAGWWTKSRTGSKQEAPATAPTP